MLNIIIKTAYLLTIILSLYTSGWLLIKAERNRITLALVGCQLLIIIWCIPQLFLSLILTREIKYLMYGISYIGISFIGPMWLEFAFLYGRKRLNTAVRILLFGIAIVNYAIFLTNEYHHLFYRKFEVEQVIYGPVFYLHMVFAYLCVLSGIAVVLAAFKRNLVASVHSVSVLLAASVPLIFNMLYMTGLIRTEFDLTPPAFAVSSLLMLLAVFRYDFLDINKMAFSELFDTISEGVIVYNHRDIITYCNQMAREWFDVQPGKSAEGLMEQVEAAGTSRKLEVKKSTFSDKKGRVIANALMFTDVSKYYQILEQREELAVFNQRLAIEQERNRIAQEVHDTIGHTLTMINSLLKLTAIEYEKTDQELSGPIPEYLEQARKLAGGGIRQLRCSINDLRKEVGSRLISQGLYQLANSVKEIEVDVAIQGEDKQQYSHLSPVIYECVREALTNCLKYADATRIDIILKFAEGSINLYLFDDGKGCDDIQAGNGIRGIRERVEKVQGEVRFVSKADEGFQISMRFPI